ncbi:hypothetical protein SLA2020_125870 [Shorea laevis]
MGVVHTSLSLSIGTHLSPIITDATTLKSQSKSKPNLIFTAHLHKAAFPTKQISSVTYSTPKIAPLRRGRVRAMDARKGVAAKPIIDFHGIDEKLIQKMVYDALVWCSLHGLLVGDKTVQRSGKVPGVGMVHAPLALLPMSFPESYWKQACELAPIFNELVDRVSLDGKFLQESLARTKKVDAFTSRLLDIHSEMLEMNKKEEIRLGLQRSDYMLDEQTKLLLQIELNTISSSMPGLSCLVSELHRSLLNDYGNDLGLDSQRIPGNVPVNQFAEALAKAWAEYNNDSSVVMVVVQSEERNMYDQHWLCSVLKEKHNVKTVRKTLAEIDSEGQLLKDGTLIVDEKAVAVVYFRAGYAPTDYPSESEWKARLLIEQSSAVKCPSISYHLAGTKKIQQELAKPNVLERFLTKKDDIDKYGSALLACGVWMTQKLSGKRLNNLIEKGILHSTSGNNIYGDDVRETLLRVKKEGSEEDAAYILMQRIFPSISLTFFMREGICHRDHGISELGIYSAYLRNKEKVLVNDQCGYLVRTKISSSNEGAWICCLG